MISSQVRTIQMDYEQTKQSCQREEKQVSAWTKTKKEKKERISEKDTDEKKRPKVQRSKIVIKTR